MNKYLLTIFWLNSLLQTGFAQNHELFPFSNGWEGADAAYSIQLDAASGRYLWLFGDTFVGSPQDTNRSQLYGLPRNSVSILYCTGPKQCTTPPQYFWSNMGTVEPRAFFDTNLDNEWFWPLDGFVWGKKLFLFLGRYRQSTNNPPDGFNFELLRVELAVIANFEAPPLQWNIAFQAIISGPTVMPGTSVVEIGQQQQDGFLYCFTAIHSSSGPNSTEFTALLRLPLAQAGAVIPPLGQGHWQYLAANGIWRPLGQQPADILIRDAKQIFPRGYTEFTVRYHPSKNRWIAVMPGQIIEAGVLYSEANAMEGPWTKPASLWSYAEMQPGHPDYTPNVFCYAAKEHPELEQKQPTEQLTFSYACNSALEEEVLENTNLYRPQLVSVPMPSSL